MTRFVRIPPPRGRFSTHLGLSPYWCHWSPRAGRVGGVVAFPCGPFLGLPGLLGGLVRSCLFPAHAARGVLAAADSAVSLVLLHNGQNGLDHGFSELDDASWISLVHDFQSLHVHHGHHSGRLLGRGWPCATQLQVFPCALAKQGAAPVSDGQLHALPASWRGCVCGWSSRSGSPPPCFGCRLTGMASPSPRPAVCPSRR